MNLLKPLFTGKTPDPEVRRALDPVTGQPVPYASSVDWKWRLTNALSAVVKYASLLAYVTGHLPGKWAAITFGVASASKDIAFIVGDYLDNGKKDNSYNPPID